MTRLLVIMGSGETTPTMIKPHRAIFDRIGDGPAALLDTPYGFQTNAEDISTRAVGYFAASVGRRIDVVSWRTTLDNVLERERALAALRDARWVFAGPGSPTYTLRHWRETPIPDLLVDKLTRDGAVVFASAAALTLGSHTVPVYEIYKAGAEPQWAPGLDLVSAATGLPVVVIPHYNNAEGGHHDTRFCYLGEQRLSAMETDLPDSSFILGVDEHTAVLLDLDAETASVVGNGVLTIRRRGRSLTYPAGSVLDFATITALVEGLDEAPAPAKADDAGSSGGSSRPATASQSGPLPEVSLRASADRLDAGFVEALISRDADGCVTTILDLVQALIDWSADTLTSDEGDHACAILRGMVVRLGQLAEMGARDPRDALAPLVDVLLDLRTAARDRRDWSTSDSIRDRLGTAGVEVRDTSDGVAWDLRQP
jgi:cyanophycinase-like exopeptidase